MSAVDFSITKQTSSTELSADDFSITNQTNLNRSNLTLSTSKEGNFLDSNGTPGSTPNSLLLPSPEEVRPFEKAQPRKLTKNKIRNRKRISAILTDTPVKKAMEQEQKAAKEKKTEGFKKQKNIFYQKSWSK